MATRLGNGDNDALKRILVDFEGGKLNDLPASAPVKAVITGGETDSVVQQSVSKNPVTGGWRLAFQVKPQKGKPLELRAFLQHNGNALTETWSYLLAP
jgi:periplasmic glucans biosynthesis protein